MICSTSPQHLGGCFVRAHSPSLLSSGRPCHHAIEHVCPCTTCGHCSAHAACKHHDGRGWAVVAGRHGLHDTCRREGVELHPGASLASFPPPLHLLCSNLDTPLCMRPSVLDLNHVNATQHHVWGPADPYRSHVGSLIRVVLLASSSGNSCDVDSVNAGLPGLLHSEHVTNCCRCPRRWHGLPQPPAQLVQAQTPQVDGSSSALVAYVRACIPTRPCGSTCCWSQNMYPGELPTTANPASKCPHAPVCAKCPSKVEVLVLPLLLQHATSSVCHALPC